MFFHSSTARRQNRSISSIAEGTMPAAETAATARPASTNESK